MKPINENVLKVIKEETITGVFKLDELVTVIDTDYESEIGLYFQCQNKKKRIGWLGLDEVEFYFEKFPFHAIVSVPLTDEEELLYREMPEGDIKFMDSFYEMGKDGND